MTITQFNLATYIMS